MNQDGPGKCEWCDAPVRGVVFFAQREYGTGKPMMTCSEACSSEAQRNERIAYEVMRS